MGSAGPPRAGREQPRRVTLARLSGELARAVAEMGRVAVEGEVHRPTVSRGGWTFFTLKDRAAQVPVAVPAKAARRSRAVNGERVLVVGTLRWQPDRGQLQLEAEEVTPVGEGAVAAMIAETRERLQAEGIIGRSPRAVPLLPAGIGVLCGSDAAVRRDIESVVAARFPGYPLVVEEATVSGPGAALSIVEALARLSERPGVDVIVLARGGGDAASLLPWSTEEVCRAVAACPVPVVSAIGHEADRPLCDEVADLRCGTPSIAAHQVVPDRGAIWATLASCRQLAHRSLAVQRQRAAERLGRVRPAEALAAAPARARQSLRHSQSRLRMVNPALAAAACRRRLLACAWQAPVPARAQAERHRAMAVIAQARALSPEHVVSRGFAVVRQADGTVVRSPGQVVAGEGLGLTVAGGEIRAVVETTAPVEGRR